ncbi:hypothetical protein D3C76_1666140 [compost metagenome]
MQRVDCRAVLRVKQKVDAVDDPLARQHRQRLTVELKPFKIDAVMLELAGVPVDLQQQFFELLE